MASQRFRNLFQVVNLRVVVFGVVSLLISLITNVLGNVLSDAPVGRTLSLLTAPTIVLGLLLLLFAPRGEIEAKIEARTLRSDDEKRRYANRGLIIFISLYRPMGGTPPAGNRDADWLKAARALNYRNLDLENSNLAPAINAVLTHASKLEHCWLIGTISTDPHHPGSLEYEGVLVEFLKQEKKIRCKFHSGKKYAVPLDDDALVCKKTYDLIRDIYREASEEFGIAAKDIVADFTGCPRSMTLGLILACLSVDRNIQLIGTRYDLAGRPTGAPYPIIFSFEPVLLTKL